MTPTEIIAEVAQIHGISPAEIKGPRQHPLFVQARSQVAMRLREKRFSLSQIGYMLGGRHHTTIWHLLRRDWVLRKVREIPYGAQEIPCPDESGIWAI